MIGSKKMFTDFFLNWTSFGIRFQKNDCINYWLSKDSIENLFFVGENSIMIID